MPRRAMASRPGRSCPSAAFPQHRICKSPVARYQGHTAHSACQWPIAMAIYMAVTSSFCRRRFFPRPHPVLAAAIPLAQLGGRSAE